MKISVKVLVLVAGLFITIPTWAQPVTLNCVKGDDQRGRVVFDEKAGTAMFSNDEHAGDASSATFTEREITWDKDISGFAHPYFTLNRTTGELRIVRHMKKGPDVVDGVWQCTVAKQAF
jgi:hypothetical protein